MILASRVLSDGRQIDVDALLYGRARLCVGTDPIKHSYDDCW
jgi:hypothetical protein